MNYYVVREDEAKNVLLGLYPRSKRECKRDIKSAGGSAIYHICTATDRPGVFKNDAGDLFEVEHGVLSESMFNRFIREIWS